MGGEDQIPYLVNSQYDVTMYETANIFEYFEANYNYRNYIHLEEP